MVIEKWMDNYEFFKTYEVGDPVDNEVIRKADRFVAIKKRRRKEKRRQKRQRDYEMKIKKSY